MFFVPLVLFGLTGVCVWTFLFTDLLPFRLTFFFSGWLWRLVADDARFVPLSAVFEEGFPFPWRVARGV